MSRGHLLIHIFILSFLLHIHILLHLCCGIRDFAAQLDLLPLGADLLVELRKLLVDIRFFFRESLP